MTTTPMIYYIVTIWVYNAESGWDRYVIRNCAQNPILFRQAIEQVRADDEVYFGPISVSKNQEW